MSTPPPDTAALLTQLLLTEAEVASALRVRPTTVANLHRVGELRGVLIGRHLRWRPSDVEAFVKTLTNGDNNGKP